MISVLIISLLVIITSLIAFTILIIIEKTFIFIERIRNQNIILVLVIGTYLKYDRFIKILVEFLTGITMIRYY